jgi:hypothetical protein
MFGSVLHQRKARVKQVPQRAGPGKNKARASWIPISGYHHVPASVAKARQWFSGTLFLAKSHPLDSEEPSPLSLLVANDLLHFKPVQTFLAQELIEEW